MTFALLQLQNRRVLHRKWLPFQTAKRHVTNVKKLEKIFALDA